METKRQENLDQIKKLMQELIDDHGALIVTCLASFDDGTQKDQTVTSSCVQPIPLRAAGEQLQA